MAPKIVTAQKETNERREHRDNGDEYVTVSEAKYTRPKIWRRKNSPGFNNELQYGVHIAGFKTNVKHFPYLYMLERVAIKCVHTVDTVKVERI